MNTNQKVWFITGGNKGPGAATVGEALTSGYRVPKPGGACHPGFANADPSMQLAT